jgi:nucleoside-diphosphate-sugar epimerase
MLIGSGLIAQAFAPEFLHRDDMCIYAAGVSNSGCINVREFARERERLENALAQAGPEVTFVYFGTCSVADPDARNTPYVQHKLAMEQLVAAHPHYLILRLSQVAGRTPNPHTLLNFLYARISRSEAFCLWRKARRNIIDINDVASISRQLFADTSMRNYTLNIANPTNYSITDIVHAMENNVGKRAVYEVVDRGSEYSIDIGKIRPILDKGIVGFDDNYLERVIGKYYGKIS